LATPVETETKKMIKRPTIDELEAILNAESGPLVSINPDGTVTVGEPKIPWLSPTEEMLKTPEFEAIWQCIKSWDVNVPEAYSGYCGANGNHVRAILDALAKIK
jgi:hypothetical protein